MSIADAVRNLLAAHLGLKPAEIKPEAHIVADLNADSLDCIEIVMACEEEFDLSITDEDAETISTVAEMVTYVERRFERSSIVVP